MNQPGIMLVNCHFFLITRNTVKLFYSAGVLMDILDQFGKVEPEISEKRKYAKWKAAYIHNCLKHGEVPIPGPIQLGEDDDSQTARHKDEINPEELKNYTRFVDPSSKLSFINLQINIENLKRVHILKNVL